MNEVFITGRMGKDPELRSVGGEGRHVVNASIAVNTGTKDKPATAWVQIVAWGYLADRLATLRKGELIFVFGGLQEDVWVKEDKSKIRQLKIVAREIVLMNDAKAGEAQPKRALPPARGTLPPRQSSTPPEDMDDCPF